MSINEYLEARKAGIHELHALQAAGKDPYLPVLAELLPEMNRLSQVSLGVCQIPITQIAGTVTRGRTTAFSRSFLPLLQPDSEFANKWALLYDGIVQDGLRQPVKALEYYNRYYIVEGNKRVSVSSTLGALSIEAEVTRLLPEPEDSTRYRVYQEFLSFYRDTLIDCILFTREGSYSHLCELCGQTPGQRWTPEDIRDLTSCFYRFSQSYKPKPEANITTSDAFLIYIEIYGYEACKKRTPKEIEADIVKIRAEYSVAASGKPAALLNEPKEDKPSLIQTLLHPKPRLLRCAFLYNSSPERSGWTYWHELGRKAVEEIFGSQVQTVAVSDVTPDTAAEKMEALIADGYTTLFVASPVLLDACIRESAAHPECQILNCSLLASYHNVRSYYLRIYEAKFCLGAIAGAMADNNKIGYIADYPIYGLPASVNAFALGAQFTNPRARVYLDWSTLPGHVPEDALAAKGISLISSRDISAPHLASRSFGLYEVREEQITSLAMPVWNWSRLYEGIIRSILTGAYTQEGAANADRAMNYYMGMSAGAIDLYLSERLPSPLSRLAELLHAQISDGGLNPFAGVLKDQEGKVRLEAGKELSWQDIISMDYLLDNIEGTIPTLSQLNETAKALVQLQGIRAAKDAEMSQQ